MNDPTSSEETRTALTEPRSELTGERIGHYIVLQKLGERGCGTVYMAEQEEPIQRRVASRVFKIGMDTKEVIARFEAERQALARPFRIAFASLTLAGGLTRAEADAGKIRIDCEAGVTISLDGTRVGVTTYAREGTSLDKMPIGQRRIGIAKPGFRPEEHAVTVEPGKTEVLAVFSLQPNPGAHSGSPVSSANPLKALVDARRAASYATSNLDAAFRERGGHMTGRSLEDMSANMAERRAAIDFALMARDAALNELTEVEATVSGEFRADYAKFQSLLESTSVPTAQKHAVWRSLTSKWNLPPDVGPCPLVWRRHQVEVARGNLRVKLGGAWPSDLGAPKRILDGRELPAGPDNPGDPAFWEFRDLIATNHTLRIEHPAIEPTEGTFLIKDSKTVVLTWDPHFKPAPAKR